MPPSKTLSARKMLELSTVSPRALQREMMGTDIDMDRFVLYISSKVMTDIATRIVSGSVSRNMQASTELAVTINDYDRAILHSDLLGRDLDVQVDGLWFRLKGVEKQGDDLTLKFEDREIAILRTYNKWKIASRSKVTRAQFILNLIREVKELDIPVVIPELRKVQPVQAFAEDTVGLDTALNKAKGIPLEPQSEPVQDPMPPAYTPIIVKRKGGAGFMVRGGGPYPANDQRLQNARIIIATCEDMRKKQTIRRKVIICALMTAIEESSLINNPGGDGTSAGLFQQIDQYWGSYEDRTDPETATRNFMKHAIAEDEKNPNLSYNDLCQAVQRSGYPYRYGQYRWEAQRILNAYGILGGDVDTVGIAEDNGQHATLPGGGGGNGEFYFWRGDIYDRAGQKYRKPEDSWTCIQRLAREVNWFGFFVSGTFYYLSQDDMLMQQPQMILTEFADGVTSLDGDVDSNKKVATLSLGVRVGRWMIPPGNVISVQNMGPFNGRWIVSEYSRDLFSLEADVTLIKFDPSLPEPAAGKQPELNTSWFPHADKGGTDDKGVAGDPSTGGIPNPIGAAASQVGVLDSVTLARQLLTFANTKQYTDDNGQQLAQIRRVSVGERLSSQCGGSYPLDVRVLQLLVWLINAGYTIGTYAICSDHDCTVNRSSNPSRHSTGHAVDISSVNGNAINSDKAGADTRNLAKVIRNSVPDAFRPIQMISGGYGNHRDDFCLRMTYGGPYDGPTLDDHTNHIHCGY